MKINSDSFFSIGRQHEICQDYAITSEDNSFVAISDGCSSSKFTDLGSKLLCYSACMTTKELGDFYEYFSSFIFAQALKATTILNVDNQCLDATLIMAFVANNRLYIFMYGDGTVAIRYTNNITRIFDYKFTENMPYYLSYQFDKNRLYSYIDFANKNNINLICTKYSSDVDIIGKEELSYANKVQFALDLDYVDFISIFSDGVSSFVDKNSGDIIDTFDIVRNMIDYQTYAGVFVKRRMKAVLKEYEKNGIHNFDDISCSTIKICHDDKK